MSFGFSVSDLVAGGKFAFDIYRQCFTKAQGADVKYLQFGREINLLGESLKRLENIVNNADVQHPRRPWHKDAHHVGPNTLQEVTGDFLATLSECQALLEDNSKFRRSTANFVDNVVWWSATERDVTSLKERVHFHVTKITLIAKPFETQLLLGIRRELKQLRRDVADLRGVLVQDLCPSGEVLGHVPKPSFSVPEDLSLRFMDALYINKPKDFEILGHLPLKEGFDGLVFAFANSTVEFNPGPGLGQNFPEETQYLNLVKSRWIANKLEESYCYRAAGADSLWADYMRELKDDIRDQFLRFDAGNLVAPPADAVARLPDSCFSIWVMEEAPPRPPDLAEERPLEEKILELRLPSSYGNRQSALTVFRKSDVELRLVSTTKDELNKDFHREESMDINMNFTRLIPAYASPDDFSKPTNNVLLCTNQGQNQKWLTLKEAADVARLQQALTGYRVFHDMPNVSWSIEGSSKPHKSGKGVLQLWHLKPLLKILLDGEIRFPESKSPTVSSPQSPPLGRKMHRYSTGFSSTTIVSTNSVKSPVKGSYDDGIALLRPEPPVLVILTMCEKRYAFLHIKLDPSISLKPELCLCHKPKKPCQRVVLASNWKKIEIRRHCVEQKDGHGLHDWDIARIRWPRHAEYKTLEVIQKKYLCLDFPTVSEKDEFIGEFGLLEGLRNLDLNDYERSFREKRHKANNPQLRKEAIAHDRKGGEDSPKTHGQSFRSDFEPSTEDSSAPGNRLQADGCTGCLPTDSYDEQDTGNSPNDRSGGYVAIQNGWACEDSIAVALPRFSSQDHQSPKVLLQEDPQCNNSAATDPPNAIHRGSPLIPEITNQQNLRIDYSNDPTIVAVPYTTESDDAPSRKEFPPEGLQNEDYSIIVPSESDCGYDTRGEPSASNFETWPQVEFGKHTPISPPGGGGAPLAGTYLPQRAPDENSAVLAQARSKDNAHSPGPAATDAKSALEEPPTAPSRSLENAGSKVCFTPSDRVEPLDITDNIKESLEILCRRTIVWWPLSPRRQICAPGFTRLSWECECGGQIYTDVPIALAQEYSSMATMFPSAAANLVLPTVQPAVSPQYSVSNSPAPKSWVSRWKRSLGSKLFHHTTSNFANTKSLFAVKDETYVYWCVDSRKFHTVLDHVVVRRGLTKDRDFIKDLRNKYRALRGWRWWISLTTCSKISLIKFARLQANESHVTRLSEGIPDQNDAEYEYELRGGTSEVHIAITEATILHQFHNDCCPTSEDGVRATPKRKRSLDKICGMKAYGLHAQHGFAFSKFIVFWLVLFPTPFGFAMWYLTTHPWDLQNAFTPFFLVVNMLALVVVLPDWKIT